MKAQPFIKCFSRQKESLGPMDMGKTLYNTAGETIEINTVLRNKLKQTTSTL